VLSTDFVVIDFLIFLKVANYWKIQFIPFWKELPVIVKSTKRNFWIFRLWICGFCCI